MKKFKFTLLSIITVTTVFGQSGPLQIPIDRQYFHDKIVKQQDFIDKLDGTKDGIFSPTKNEDINLQLSDVLNRKIKQLRYWVEENKAFVSKREKIQNLSYIENVLIKFRSAYSKRAINVLEFPELIQNFEDIVKAVAAGKTIIPLLEKEPYQIASINADIFKNTPEGNQVKNIVYLKYVGQNQTKIMQTIQPYVNQPFADSLLAIAALKTPSTVYTYAQNKNSPEEILIRNSKRKAVETIYKLSQMPTGLNYFPFLDNIIAEKINIPDIQKLVGDGEKGYDFLGFYKLLINTEIGYAKRLAAKDTPNAMFGPNGLRDVLKTRALRHFIKPINDLHESPENIRMRAIQPLSAQELYYMIVMGESDIYTSSYKHSFNRLVALGGGKFRGDSLMQSVNYDYFKKFIKMAANYNQLDLFLGSMQPENAAYIMKSFVSNLEAGDNLEDAVDVADSYSSIVNKDLRKTMLNYVKEFEQTASVNGNRRGKIIYELLKNIFLSADSSSNVDLSQSYGISSIFDIKNDVLKDHNGRIVEQVFFYGDEDGKSFYPHFVNSFPANEWTITSKPEWTEIKSKKNNVFVFVNKPLDSDKNLDDSAQVHLGKYLKTLDMHPSIVVHRGHSYWLKGTINRMPDNAKIVVIGSCGGYQNLNEILEISPDAHIISTKEIGAGNINKPILNYINQTMLDGKTLEWRDMWKSLTAFFGKDPSKSVRESWEDYVPPYKNLGAIFIKAYNMQMEKDM